jgi:hypothetical protein
MLPPRKTKRIGREAASFNALNATIRGFDLQSDGTEKYGNQLAVVTGRGGQVMIGQRVEDQDLVCMSSESETTANMDVSRCKESSFSF